MFCSYLGLMRSEGRPIGHRSNRTIDVSTFRLRSVNLRLNGFNIISLASRFCTSRSNRREDPPTRFTNAWSRIHALTSPAHVPPSHVVAVPTPRITGKMPGTPTARRNIRPGQLIWGSMIIDSVALRRPDGSMAPAMKKIFKGKAVEKLAYVLEVRENHVFAAYATTLGSATQLSRVVSEPDHWYPVFPAPINGRLRPLDPVDGKAAWIYLGMPVVMSYEPIYVLDNGLSTESLRLVRQAMIHQRFELGE